MLDQKPVALTIATSDSGGGAGVQADLKAFAANGVYGVSAFAALTAQSPDGVSAIHELPPEFLSAQLEQLHAYYRIGAAKTGMLFSQKLIRETAAFIERTKIPLVVDPVMVATSGATLLQPDAIETLKIELLPLATLVTPNLDETAVLLGERPTDVEGMKEAGHALAIAYGVAFLIKGGHLETDELVDVLVTPEGEVRTLSSQRNPDINTHGSGCTLSAAIAANLAKGMELTQAVVEGCLYLMRALWPGQNVGGVDFIDHFPEKS